jgi:hypothetical protein
MRVAGPWRALLQAAWAPLWVLASFPPVLAAAGESPAVPVDAVFHFLGGVAGAYFVERAYAALPETLGRPSALALRLIALCVVCLAAVLWELGELASDVYLGTRMQADAPELLSDVFLGIAGAGAFGAASLWRARESNRVSARRTPSAA